MRLFSARRTRAERQIERAAVMQLDASDCGAACLAWIIRYYGGEEPLERLRRLSGTTPEGTTLLGIHQASGEVGLISEAYRAGIGELSRLDVPSILHVRLPSEREHFVICFGRDETGFLIGDPAAGTFRLSSRQLDEMWRSGALLTLRPGRRFVRQAVKSASKRNWLVTAVRADADTLALATLLGGVISVLGLATAIFSKELVDDILPRHDTSKLAIGLSLLLFVLIAQSGLVVVRHLLLLRQARAFSNRITTRFLNDLLRLSYHFFSSRKTGDLIARLYDTERLQMAVTHVLGGAVINLLMLIVGLAFVLAQSAAVASVLVAAICLFPVIAWRFHGPILDAQRQVMSAHSRNKSGYVDAIRGIEAIKASNAENIFRSLMRDTHRRLQDEVYYLGTAGLHFAGTLEVIGSIGLAAVLAWSSVQVLNDSLEIGSLVAILQMTGVIVPSARALAVAYIELQEALVAFDRIYQLTSLPPESNETEQAEKCRIEGVRRLEVRDVIYRHPGRPALLDGVSLRCSRGELVLIIGRTGSGKSSLLQLIQRLIQPESGRVLVNGCECADYSITSWREVLGVMPQQVQIFSGTLLDNIRFGQPIDPDTVIQQCERLGLSGFFNVLPSGYLTLVGESGVTLSGGQRQLVGLARALVRDAPVLLLDEPTSSMDVDTARSVMDVIDGARRNRIVIVASHASTFRSRADRVYRLEGGTVRLELERTGRLRALRT